MCRDKHVYNKGTKSLTSCMLLVVFFSFFSFARLLPESVDFDVSFFLSTTVIGGANDWPIKSFPLCSGNSESCLLKKEQNCFSSKVKIL